jgi:hypothetical protein
LPFFYFKKAKQSTFFLSDFLNTQNVDTCFVGQSKHGLNTVELVHVFALVRQDFTIRIVDNGFLYNRRLNNVIHFLRDNNCFAKELSDSLKEVLDIIAFF